jgi:hypothetical protein
MKIKRKHLLLVMFLLAAAALTLLKIPAASSQGVTLVSGWVEGDLPVEDASAAAWQSATALEVPLSAQNVAKPFLLESKIKSVTVRALQNEAQVAFLVEWADATEDDSSVAIQDFRDAAALQFPLREGQPFFCMGQQGGNVNLWHWKADWQAEIFARKEMEAQYPDMYVDYYPYAEAAQGKLASVAEYTDQNYLPAAAAGNLLAATTLQSPVEDLVAGGFGTLTAEAAEGQNVQGFGTWQDGKWQVIFSRSLDSAEAEDVVFEPGKTYSVAFAVWDGANEERNGQKSTSQWVSLQLSEAPGAPAATAPEEAPAQTPASSLTRNLPVILFSVLALVVIVLGFIAIRLPE